MIVPNKGFTLIELVITLAVVGLLMMIGIPDLTQWIQNSQIRTAAEAITNGLQTARNEAVTQNTNIVFVLGTQSDYTVSLVSTGAVIRTHTSQEGTSNATVTVTPAGATTVTFNSFGRVAANGDASAPITQIDVNNASLAPAKARPMRVVVANNVRMCDPAVAVGDPRAC